MHARTPVQTERPAPTLERLNRQFLLQLLVSKVVSLQFAFESESRRYICYDHNVPVVTRTCNLMRVRDDLTQSLRA